MPPRVIITVSISSIADSSSSSTGVAFSARIDAVPLRPATSSLNTSAAAVGSWGPCEKVRCGKLPCDDSALSPERLSRLPARPVAFAAEESCEAVAGNAIGIWESVIPVQRGWVLGSGAVVSYYECLSTSTCQCLHEYHCM